MRIKKDKNFLKLQHLTNMSEFELKRIITEEINADIFDGEGLTVGEFFNDVYRLSDLCQVIGFRSNRPVRLNKIVLLVKNLEILG